MQLSDTTDTIIDRITTAYSWISSNLDATGYSLAAVATVSSIGLAYYIWSQKQQQIPCIVSFSRQTNILPDGSRVVALLNSVNDLTPYQHKDMLTLYEVIPRGAKISNNGPMLGTRRKQPDGTEPYTWITYNEVLTRVDYIAQAMRVAGIPAGQGGFICIYARNCEEWVIVEHASYAFSNVVVPLYATLGPDACTFTINQTESTIVFADELPKAQGILAQIENVPTMKNFVVMVDSIDSAIRDAFDQAGCSIWTFAEFEALGKNASRQEHQKPKPEDLATICYTSGTTGTPKGVMLTHGNIIADVTTYSLFSYVKVGSDDVMMSFLPLAHMFERLMENIMYEQGGRVGFYRGDIRKLTADMQELKPTIIPLVPRILNRIYDTVMTNVNKSVVKKILFNLALAFKNQELRRRVVRNDSIVDGLFFKPIRDELGGNVKILLTGSAPLSENVLNFIRASFGCVVIEGYGQTECTAGATVTIEGDYVPGHVGVPSPCNAVKLVDVPELNYFAKDDAGEICIKGHNVFIGYYKNEEQTKETLDSDGWLHTGDIGRWTSRGTLKIVDRKKHIFKLAQGEYIAPEKIEIAYSESKLVAQSFVHGESLKTCLIGIIVPDPHELKAAVKQELNLTGISFSELCKRDDVKQLILKDILAIGKKVGLHSFEQLKDIYVTSEFFSVENGLLTPTLKSKRPQLKAHFKKQIDQMYSKLS